MDFAPTPIQFLWEDEQGNRVYVKREDLLPYSFGGNKARIGLEYLADMERQGKDHLIAYGNARSNLCRVLSNLCCARNIPCTILSPADDDGQRRPSFNQRFCESFGAQIVPCLKTGVKGDLLLTVVVETPKRLTEKQKTLLRELEESMTGKEYEGNKSFRDKLRDLFN